MINCISGSGSRAALRRALAENDSYHFFEAAQSLFRPGPTNTNVCNLQIAIIL